MNETFFQKIGKGLKAIGKAIKTFVLRVADMFLDQEGGTDEKRVLGIPIIIISVAFVVLTRDLAVFAAVSGLGLLLLGIAVSGDQGKLGGSNIAGSNGSSASSSSSSTGIPGS